MRQLIAFLMIILLITSACNQNSTSESRESKKIVVAVFNGNGASPICVLETKEALKIDPQIRAVEITAAQIQQGALDTVDVLIFPGGSGSKELNNLGHVGAEKVRKFVLEQGKGIVGICAGAYLLSTTPTYPSLQLLDAMNYDRKHYARGRGLIQGKLTQKGLEVFPELKGKQLFLQYYDGPILAALDSNNITYVELAKYVSDIHANPGIPSGITPGKSLIIFQNVGKGKIMACGGHPEATPGLRWMIPRMARYVHDGKIVKYADKWYNPDQYKAEYMFTPERKKLEKQLFWKLFNDTAQVRIAAIKQLFYQMHSRPAVRWAIGLLRDKDPQVRATAAKILKDAEYTAALPDIKTAFNHETDPKAKQAMKEAIALLQLP